MLLLASLVAVILQASIAFDERRVPRFVATNTDALFRRFLNLWFSLCHRCRLVTVSIAVRLLECAWLMNLLDRVRLFDRLS